MSASPIQSMLWPTGDQAAAIGGVWNLLLVVCTLIYLLVLAWLAHALLTRMRAGAATTGHAHDGRLHVALTVFVAVVVLVLTWFVAASYLTDRRLHAGNADLAIRITAKQWWWQVEYLDPDVSKRFTTANELVLPRDRTVRVELRSGDVIHSFWIPNLSGKEDLIPGHANALLLTPRVAGTFRGQCAEFCGLQHAHMALDVQVRSPAQFDAWRAHQLTPPPPPATPTALRGQQVFVATACAMCHAISGTPANSHVGPDLTHVASRRTLAAGTLPMDAGHLEAWIADPQHFKPGANMPAVPLRPADLAAVSEYLMGLR